MTHRILQASFIALVAVVLWGCSTQTADLTTTAQSSIASVDNAGTIAAGAKVVSANTATGTTISTVVGTNLTITPAATTTGTVQATFQNTVAIQLAADEKAYTQTVANFLQTQGPLILANVGKAAQLTAALSKQLQAWGLDPSTNGQRTILGNAIAIASKVGTNAASLNSTLTGISATGTVPTTI